MNKQTEIARRIMDAASPEAVLVTVNWDDDTHYQSWEASLDGMAVHLSRYLHEDQPPSPIHIEVATLDSNGEAIDYPDVELSTVEVLQPLVQRLADNTQVIYADGLVLCTRNGFKVSIDVTVFPHEGTFASEVGTAKGGLWFDKQRSLACYDTVLRLPQAVGEILNSLGYQVDKAYYGV